MPSSRTSHKEPDLFGDSTLPAATPAAPESVVALDEKASHAFKTISEAANFLSLPQHVLRFWETKFSQLKPLKLKGGRRYYRPQDVDTLVAIKHLLYKQGYTIRGAKKALPQAKKAQNIEATKELPAPGKLRKQPADMRDAPLFKVSHAAPAANAPDDRKRALQAIHEELMKLREAARELTDA